MRMRRMALNVALLSVLTPATAQAAPARADVVVHDLAVSQDAQKAVLDYWTPERIASMPTGPSTPGTPPEDGPDGAGWAPGTHTDRSIGRLFFVSRDGEDASCTATVLPSAARGVIVTAGHCVHELNLIGEDPKWTTNLLFVPGFRDNTRPFGSFTARASIVDRTWTVDDQRSQYDQAFLVLNGHVPGVPQSIAYDVPGGLRVQEFGYPRAANKPGHQGRREFTGQRPAHCWGTAVQDPGPPDYPQDPGIWGVPCDMGGGASGGPRIAFFADKAGLGTVVGVNVMSAYIDSAGNGCDLGDPRCTRHLVGAQFTAAITRPLYERALKLG
jgi:hypothetical protein